MAHRSLCRPTCQRPPVVPSNHASGACLHHCAAACPACGPLGAASGRMRVISTRGKLPIRIPLQGFLIALVQCPTCWSQAFHNQCHIHHHHRQQKQQHACSAAGRIMPRSLSQACLPRLPVCVKVPSAAPVGLFPAPALAGDETARCHQCHERPLQQQQHAVHVPNEAPGEVDLQATATRRAATCGLTRVATAA